MTRRCATLPWRKEDQFFYMLVNSILKSSQVEYYICICMKVVNTALSTLLFDTESNHMCILLYQPFLSWKPWVPVSKPNATFLTDDIISWCQYFFYKLLRGKKLKDLHLFSTPLFLQNITENIKFCCKIYNFGYKKISVNLSFLTLGMNNHTKNYF